MPSKSSVFKRSSKKKCYVSGMRYSRKWGCKKPCISPMRRNARGGCSTPKKRKSKSKSKK